MTKKDLTKILKKQALILILSCYSFNIVAAELPSLPAPMPSIEEPAETTSSKKEEVPSKSFGQKIKSFFSFGKDTNKEKSNVSIPKEPTKALIDKETTSTLDEKEEPYIDLDNIKLPQLPDEPSNSKNAESKKPQSLPTPSKAVTQPETMPLPSTATLPPPPPNRQKTPAAPPQLPPLLTEEVVTPSQKAVDLPPPPLQQAPAASPQLPPLLTEEAVTPNQKTADLPPPPPPPVAGSIPIINSQTIIDANESNIKDKQNSKNLDMTTDQAKFVSDEAKVLLLPDGDVVLGCVSESAQIELMDAYSYISLFNSINQSYRQVVMLSKINKFIENYDEKFYPKINYTDDDYNYLFIDAAVAAAKNGFFQLKTLIDNYPILQRMDAHGYTLLHITSELDNYTLTKYLLMRGINIDVLNYNNDSALRIAEDQGNENIAQLLKKAGAK